MPPKCKLIYFPVTGRAEMTRLMFAAAGVKYEDERIKWEDWPKLKTGAMTHKYKMIYFPRKGRAEMTRLVFAATGVKFEDERITLEDWPKLKPEVPQGLLPILEIDGKVILAQSLTIARYIARELKFYGKNNLEAARIDQILDTLQDLMTASIPYLAESKQDKAKKDEARKKFCEGDALKYLGFLEKAIADGGKDDYAVSSSLSVADFAIFAFLEFFGLEFLLDKFPKIAASCKKVESNKNVAKWLKERPANVFHPVFGP